MAAISLIQQFGLIACGILLQILCGILITIGPTTACKLPQHWRSKTIKERMRQASAEIVVKGVILDKYEIENSPMDGEDVYSSRIQVLCVYKGPIVAERITVAGFGPNDCIDTNVGIGSTYIILMMQYGDHYQLVEVNSQMAVLGWSSRMSPAIIEEEFPCRKPYMLPPTTPLVTTTTNSPTTTPTTELMIIAMVTTESERKVTTTTPTPLITTRERTTPPKKMEKNEIEEEIVEEITVPSFQVMDEYPGAGCKSHPTLFIVFILLVIIRFAME